LGLINLFLLHRIAMTSYLKKTTTKSLQVSTP